MVGLNSLLLSTQVYVYLSSVTGVLYTLFYKSYKTVLGHKKAIVREFWGEGFFEVTVSQGTREQSKANLLLTHTDFWNWKAYAGELQVHFLNVFAMDPGSMYTQVFSFLLYVQCRFNILSQLALVLHFFLFSFFLFHGRLCLASDVADRCPFWESI